MQNTEVKTDDNEADEKVDPSIEICKKRKCDPRYRRMTALPADPCVPGWVLNLRVSFEERYWNYVDRKRIESEDETKKTRLIEYREKLEKCAKEYLELVPQQIKFYDSRFMYEVIFDSAKRDPDGCNLELICRDLKIIEEFSFHLMKFPGKFKNIQFGNNGHITFDSSDKVCLQNVESFGFQSMEMGHRLITHLGFTPTSHSGGTKLLLQGPLDSFWVNEFARDCIVAVEEFKLTSSVRKAVAEKFSSTWEEVCRHRFKYPGTADQAIRELILIKTNQKYHQNAQFLESYINRKECEKEKIVSQSHHSKKEILDATKKYEDMCKKYEDMCKKYEDVSKKYEDMSFKSRCEIAEVNKKFSELSNKYEEVSKKYEDSLNKIEESSKKNTEGLLQY